MKRQPAKFGLPNSVAASWFACQCFGVGVRELNGAMQRLRKTDTNPAEHLPWKFERETIRRAKQGSGPWSEALVAVCCRALADRIRWLDGKPLFSFTAQVTERLVFLLLRLYERVSPRLETCGIPEAKVMWGLVEHVFLPTVFINLIRDWRCGLGSEFEGERCWYLPKSSNAKVVKPIPKVLDSWLRVAGYRTAYGVGTKMEEKWRGMVDRWLNGDFVPTLDNLHRLVDKFAEDIGWLDGPEDWKARFTLARAVQKLCDTMDKSFSEVCRKSSLELGHRMRGMVEERIVANDESGVLGGDQTFFAVRLLQLRLREEGKWEKEIIARMPSGNRGFGPEATDEEIRDYRQSVEWGMKQGNWVLEWIKKEVHREQQEGKMPASCVELDEQIFELGIRELKRLMENKEPAENSAGLDLAT